MSGSKPLISNAGRARRAIAWKKKASSIAETSACPMPPSIAWYGQTVSR